ncbi:MAG: hypothetical protein ABI794_06585 [Betaproteobacteria bacterium]
MSANERLSISRERIRRFLHGEVPEGPTRPGQRAAWAPEWLERVRQHPIAGTIVDTVHDWWVNHPILGATRIAGFAARRTIRPLADRYPLPLVAAAVVMGALLFWARPWRLVLRRALLVGLAMRIARRVLVRLPANGAVDAMAALFASKAARRRRRSDSGGSRH